MHYVFSPADKRMFASTQEILGGPSEEALLSRLIDGVFGEDDSIERNLGPVDESFLRRIGADELGMLPDVLVPGGVLQSLRATLLNQGDSGPDLQLRAGLHRLGRAAADLDASSLRRTTEGLPRAWARCVQAAWFRLSRLEECRASAASLRELFRNGDRK
jgi:hypothetical protein